MIKQREKVVGYKKNIKLNPFFLSTVRRPKREPFAKPPKWKLITGVINLLSA